MDKGLLPLFPLNVVLFPQMPLPLHIFEERYKLMIHTCLQGSLPFGVVLIKSGSEVGEPAEPYSVGTIAKIADFSLLEEGRMNIIVTGVRPFRILEIVQQKPYIIGEVEPLAYQREDEPLAELAYQVIDRFQTYVELLASLAGVTPQIIPQVEDEEFVSYLVASAIQVDLSEKQLLLETVNLGERLRREAALLQRENQILRMLNTQQEQGLSADELQDLKRRLSKN